MRKIFERLKWKKCFANFWNFQCAVPKPNSPYTNLFSQQNIHNLIELCATSKLLCQHPLTTGDWTYGLCIMRLWVGHVSFEKNFYECLYWCFALVLWIGALILWKYLVATATANGRGRSAKTTYFVQVKLTLCLKPLLFYSLVFGCFVNPFA